MNWPLSFNLDTCALRLQEFLQMHAHVYRKLLKQLVKTDLAVFEEKQLHDLLLCRAQASSSSVKDEDSYSMWEQRLEEQLDKRQFYQQVSKRHGQCSCQWYSTMCLNSNNTPRASVGFAGNNQHFGEVLCQHDIYSHWAVCWRPRKRSDHGAVTECGQSEQKGWHAEQWAGPPVCSGTQQEDDSAGSC